jgi:hypothetical protein
MPAAWEIIESRRNSTLIVTITPPSWSVTVEWAQRFRKMWTPPNSDIAMLAGMPYGQARNMALKTALDKNYQWLAFLDADTLPPNDWLKTLLDTGHQYIAGMYHQRFPPFSAVHATATVKEGELTRGPFPAHTPGEIVPVAFLATGLTLISRQVMEAVLAKFNRPFEWGLDIARVPAEEDGEYLPAFSEDFMFAYRAATVGYQGWVHTGVQADHEMSGIVDMKGFRVVSAKREG